MIESGKSPTKLEAMSELLKYCLLGRYIAVHAVDSVRSSQPTYEACDDNLDAPI